MSTSESQREMLQVMDTLHSRLQILEGDNSWLPSWRKKEPKPDLTQQYDKYSTELRNTKIHLQTELENIQSEHKAELKAIVNNARHELRLTELHKAVQTLQEEMRRVQAIVQSGDGGYDNDSSRHRDDHDNEAPEQPDDDDEPWVPLPKMSPRTRYLYEIMHKQVAHSQANR